MSDIYSQQAYHGTVVAGTVTTDPIYKICATANINASNQFETSFWINLNGLRINSGLGNASYRVRDKAGALVSGVAQASVVPDGNGYFHTTPVSAELLYDLNHFILEIDIPVDGVQKSSSIGLISGG